MPDPLYKVEGTFYMLGDFSDLFGMALPMEASRALGKTGVVTTSEELAYYLLFKDSLMIAPGAYFGMPPESGFMRITCSGTHEELQHLMERLERCLLQARQIKTDKLWEEINHELSILYLLDANSHQLIKGKIALMIDQRGDCLALKHQNQELMQLLSEIRVLVKRATPEGQISAAKTICTFYSHAVKERKKTKIADDLKTQWKNYINDTVSEDGALKNYLLNLSDTQKATYKPWVEHLQPLQKQDDVNSPKT